VKLTDLVELVRAPAALTAPGDTLAGGAHGLGLATSSVCLYWAGMALNDYADRERDAVERPERPIPSGRVRPGQALALAVGLTGAGLVLAAAAGGRRALRTAVPLAATVWAYDLRLKDTAAGPVAMATARGLDVLLGGQGGAGAAAAAIAVHTYGITTLSRGEVTGTSPAVAVGALAATATATGLAVLAPRGTGNPVGVGLAAVYAFLVGRAQLAAARQTDAATTRTAVGTGILGLLALQAGLVAQRGRYATAMALAAGYPLARRLSRKVSPT
jgi:4-hydroxybenzoate polyprenyltransferase